MAPVPSSTGRHPSQMGRPDDVIKLLEPPELTSTFFLSNRGKNRFFLLNIREVMNQLGVFPNSARQFFDDAKNIITAETSWRRDYPFAYGASPTQISDRRIFQAKLFDIAVTVIVAMEVAAVAKAIDINVYDHLRILGAHYFVDRFDEEHLTKLSRYYAELPASEKSSRFGNGAESKTFQEVCLPAIEQAYSPNLLNELSEGDTATKYVCEKFVEFINNKFPESLHLGKVLQSGHSTAVNSKLGKGNSAKSLLVPKTLAVTPITNARVTKI